MLYGRAMNIFKALHVMSKIHDVVKPMKVGDIVKETRTNRMYKVVEIKHDTDVCRMCKQKKTPFCKFVVVRSWDNAKGFRKGTCYKSFHKVGKTDRFVYHIQGRNALNDYMENRAPTPATNCDDADGIS